MPIDPWFRVAGRSGCQHDLNELRYGIGRGFVDRQDDYGYTALMLAAWAEWFDGVDELLRAGADTELRSYRTGTTALYDLVLKPRPKLEMARRLVSAGANPDAPNRWGVTPRRWAPELFADVPVRATPMPDPRIQNAEHLADHYHPDFEIPELAERVDLRPGQAVKVYVYGPKSAGKTDQVKVRIDGRAGDGRDVQYTAKVETPIERTHLAPDTTYVKFGPEHVATVFIPRPGGAE